MTHATTWYWLDLVIVGIIVLSMVTGLIRGFVKELMALCIWALAIFVAFKFSYPIEMRLEPYIHDKTMRLAAAFMMVLISCILLGGLINGLLSFVLKRSGLSGTDRLLGMGFGFMRGVFIVALFMVVVKITAFPYQPYADQSQLYAHFDPVVSGLERLMPDMMQKIHVFDQTSDKKLTMANYDIIDDA